MEYVDKYIGYLKEADPHCYVVLVGTKLDLSEKREVSYDEAVQLAEKYRAPFYETSAKSNINVSDVFDNIGFHCLSSRLNDTISQSEPKVTTLSPALKDENAELGCRCIIH